MEQLFALINVLRLGNAVDDPAKWKKRQITANALAPLIVALGALAQAYGINMPLSAADATALAGGVIVVVNVLLTLATSRSVGVGRAADGGAVEQGTSPVPAAGPDAGTDGTSADSAVVQGDGEARIKPGVDPFGDHGA